MKGGVDSVKTSSMCGALEGEVGLVEFRERWKEGKEEFSFLLIVFPISYAWAGSRWIKETVLWTDNEIPVAHKDDERGRGGFWGG